MTRKIRQKTNKIEPLHYLIYERYTPNCNNVVIEKSKKQKAKSQIGIY